MEGGVRDGKDTMDEYLWGNLLMERKRYKSGREDGVHKWAFYV